MKWYYLINKGLVCNEYNIRLLFGMDRENLRKILSYNPYMNKGRFDVEDSYQDLFSIPNQCIRLAFKNGVLFEIEILKGIVIFDGVTIQTHTALDEVLIQLRSKGHLFQEWEYGYQDAVSKIDLGDSEKNGGVGNLIYWILISECMHSVE